MKSDKPLTPFEKFAARRIAEFPTLYYGKDKVITDCVLHAMGDCQWKGGILVQGDRHYCPKRKKMVPYPLRMPLKTAAELHAYRIPSFSYGLGSERAPISKLPNDIDKSYLEAISVFLFVWGRLTKGDWELAARAKCLACYQKQENVHAGEPGRTMEGYERFMKLRPTWEARIREIEYFQRHGVQDSRVFQGENI